MKKTTKKRASLKTEFKIEKGIPVPPIRQPAKYPFDEMKIGDSFFVKAGKPSRQSNITYSAKTRGVKVRTRKEKDGFRVWRVE